MPGVVSASYSSDALLDGGLWTSDIRVEGQSEKGTVEVQMLAVSPGFFETMRIPLAMGRTFGAADLDSTQPVAIVNKAFAAAVRTGREGICTPCGPTRSARLVDNLAPRPYRRLTDSEPTSDLAIGEKRGDDYAKSMTLTEALKKISNALGKLTFQIRMENRAGMYSKNRLTEDILLPVFQIALNAPNLRNLNQASPNFPLSIWLIQELGLQYK